MWEIMLHLDILPAKLSNKHLYYAGMYSNQFYANLDFLTYV
nr:MAG TPA: hypothetical protein [Caudoviricetes sp.]DAN23238.1 MAG TPA_asm: hypothetical protein [Bacteriophage sp.]